jgi:hypothetical protein
MWISIAPPETSPSQAVGDALSVLRDAAVTRWAAQSDDELEAVLGQVRRLVAAAGAVEAGVRCELDVRGAALPPVDAMTGSPGSPRRGDALRVHPLETEERRHRPDQRWSRGSELRV